MARDDFVLIERGKGADAEQYAVREQDVKEAEEAGFKAVRYQSGEPWERPKARAEAPAKAERGKKS